VAAVIVRAVRTAVGRAPRGALRYTRPDEMAATVIRAAVERAGNLDPALVDDVIFGCAMPEAEQGLNVARIAAIRAGVPVSASAVTVNRFCASGLESIAIAAERIAAGGARAVIAGGTESMSLIPMGGNKIAPNPRWSPSTRTCISAPGSSPRTTYGRLASAASEQDAFALESHQRAIAAIDAGRFADEIVPLVDRGRFGVFDRRGPAA
jgi:acetyl-CoA acyltransferase